jgi:IS30 family transposase
MRNPYNQPALCAQYQIKTFKELGFSVRKIAGKLRRPSKTVSKKLIRCPLTRATLKPFITIPVVKKKKRR